MTRISAFFMVLLAAGCARGDDAPLTDLEQKFQQSLSGATLVGHFTMSNQPTGKLSEERYTISKVTKVPGKKDIWRFVVRIQYGKFDVNVPLDLTVKWAEETPMITMTDFTIPVMGTFSARVLFFRDQYAGTWQHGKVGGHLFGKIERRAASPDSKKTAGEPSSSSEVK
jgi:hypothetical protein